MDSKEKPNNFLYPFATKTGIELLFAMLLHQGAMCSKCGYGTKKTSKNWAKCKKCGNRVPVKEEIEKL